MGRQRRLDMDWAAIRCGLGGLLLIAVVGAMIGWAGFVVAERMRKADAARRLEGAWSAGKGAGFRFAFGRGAEGTVEGRGADVRFTERVCVVWRREQEAVIAIGPDRRRSDLYLVTFTANPDRGTMRGEGEQSGTLTLLRQTGSPAR